MAVKPRPQVDEHLRRAIELQACRRMFDQPGGLPVWTLDRPAVTEAPRVVVIPFADDLVARVETFLSAFRRIKPLPIAGASTSQESEENQLAGKLAEGAIGALLQLPVCWDVTPGADTGADLVLRDGSTLSVRAVAVRANPHAPFTLIVRAHEPPADRYVLALVRLEAREVWVAGYCTAAQVAATARPMHEWTHRDAVIPRGVPRLALSPFEQVVHREELAKGVHRDGWPIPSTVRCLMVGQHL